MRILGNLVDHGEVGGSTCDGLPGTVTSQSPPQFLVRFHSCNLARKNKRTY